ncbi:MAG: dihydrolipoyl dehydrogenase [Chlamydiae bacterium]|nr:dihydrolipoyl dehydrogenase [Chlamydiota bacterium]
MEESFDVVIIGAGPAGYVAAIRCAQLGLKTACIEKRMEHGGTCLNVGCIPSKTLLYSSELYNTVHSQGSSLGIVTPSLSFDFQQMMKRKRDVISSLNEGIKGLFKKNKITHFIGSASFLSSESIQIFQGPTTTIVRAKKFIIATGSEPTPLPFLPFDERKVLSSTGALSLDKVPKSLIVVGAGVIGVELGSVYARLGSHVVFLEFLDKICPMFDGSISKSFQDILQKQGMQFHLSCKVVGAEVSDKSVIVKAQKNSDASLFSLEAEAILVSIGRRPYTEGLGLDKIGVLTNAKGQIPVDSMFRTSCSNVYAIGDVIDGPMLAHKASEEGTCVAEVIAGHTPSLDYIAIPNVVYTHPELASVGLTEEEAKSLDFSITTGSYFFKSNSRGKCAQQEEGFVKIIVDTTSDIVLGIHILGAHASEMITLAVSIIHNRMKCEDLSSLCFPHPTLSEAIKEAALSVHKKAIHK